MKTLLLGALFVIGCQRPPAPAPTVEEKVFVSCAPNSSHGMTCSITHPEGVKPLGVCFDIVARCSTLGSYTARACGIVSPEGATTVLVPLGDFQLSGGCERVTTISVEHLSVLGAP